MEHMRIRFPPGNNSYYNCLASWRFDVPRSGRLEVTDPYTVNMKRNPPAKPNARISVYTIKWRLHYAPQENVAISLCNVNTIARLKPRQMVFTAVYAQIQQRVVVKFEYNNSRLILLSVTTSERGWSFPLLSSTRQHDWNPKFILCRIYKIFLLAGI